MKEFSGSDYKNIKDVEIKPLWVRILCVHKFTGGVRTIYDKKGRKRHARICWKCGQREYTD